MMMVVLSNGGMECLLLKTCIRSLQQTHVVIGMKEKDRNCHNGFVEMQAKYFDWLAQRISKAHSKCYEDVYAS